MSGTRDDGSNPRARGDNPRAKRRKVKVKEPVELVLADGTVIGRLTAIELELDELAPAAEAEQLTIGPVGSGFDPVVEVHRHYVAVMKPRNAGLDAETRKLIRDALKVGTVDEWKRAVDGCKASSFHMGQNDRGRKYNKPSHIFKGKRGVRTTREQLDMFLDILTGGRGSRVTSEGDARVRRAKRDVLDGIEFPGDAHVVEKAQRARAWLEQQSWKIIEKDGGVEFESPTSS